MGFGRCQQRGCSEKGSPPPGLLLTARLRPAFLDDPVLADRCIAHEIQPFDCLESAALWTGVGIPGSRADAVATATLLRGNP